MDVELTLLLLPLYIDRKSPEIIARTSVSVTVLPSVNPRAISADGQCEAPDRVFLHNMHQNNSSGTARAWWSTVISLFFLPVVFYTQSYILRTTVADRSRERPYYQYTKKLRFTSR